MSSLSNAEKQIIHNLLLDFADYTMYEQESTTSLKATVERYMSINNEKVITFVQLLRLAKIANRVTN